MKLNFKGRLQNKDFIISIIFALLISWISVFVLWAPLVLFTTIFGLGISSFASLILLFIPLATSIILSWSISVRRHHDLNQSWTIPIIVSFVLLILYLIDKSIGGLMSLVYFLYLAFSKSVDEGNKYGKLTTYKNIWEKIGIIKNEK